MRKTYIGQKNAMRKTLYWINVFTIILIFSFSEIKAIDELQIIGSEPTLSGDIRLKTFTPPHKNFLFGNEKFGIEIHGAPYLFYTSWVKDSLYKQQNIP